MRVLLVDNSVLILRRLEEMLLISGNTKTIYNADSYSAGLEFFESHKPDLVILGISSPEEKSIKLLSSIKARNKTIPVIILSLNMNDNLHEQCKQLGADFFLDKYYEFQEIPAIISRIAKEK